MGIGPLILRVISSFRLAFVLFCLRRAAVSDAGSFHLGGCPNQGPFWAPKLSGCRFKSRIIGNPRKLEHGFRRIGAGFPFFFV